MKLFLDTAIINDVEKRLDYGVISGVTTNPTLIKKSGEQPDDVYRFLINDLSIENVSIEVNGTTSEKLVENGITYGKLYPDAATIKLPCTPEGIKACKYLNYMGIPVNMTLVFSVEQAILCSLAGATYVSPFIGRLDDNGVSGIDLIRDIREVFNQTKSETQILAASIRDAETASLAYVAGADICTVPVGVFDDMFKHYLTDAGLHQFLVDSGQA